MKETTQQTQVIISLDRYQELERLEKNFTGIIEEEKEKLREDNAETKSNIAVNDYFFDVKERIVKSSNIFGYVKLESVLNCL